MSAIAPCTPYTTTTVSTLELYATDVEVDNVITILNEGKALNEFFKTAAEACNFLIHDVVRNRVTHLDFTGLLLTPNQFKDIALKCSQVATLNINCSDLSQVDFSRLPTLESLKDLNVSYCMMSSPNCALLGRNIEKLNVAYCSAVDIKTLKSIKLLTIGGMSQLTTSFVQDIECQKLVIVISKLFNLSVDKSVDPKLNKFLTDYSTKGFPTPAEKIEASGLRVQELEILM